MSDCVFCKIVAGQIPSSKVFENDKILAILDINPLAFGHTLVMPKSHHELLTDMPSDLAKDVIEAVHKLAPAVVKAASAEGFNVLQNNKGVAGQAVPHVHFHIIPRVAGDFKFNWNPMKYPEGKLDETLSRIKSALS